MALTIIDPQKKEPVQLPKGYTLDRHEETGVATLLNNGFATICPFQNRTMAINRMNQPVPQPYACSSTCPHFCPGDGMVTITCSGIKREIVLTGEIKAQA